MQRGMKRSALLVFSSMGAGGDPLYWGPLLEAVSAAGVAVRVLAGHPLDSYKLPGCSVAAPIRAANFVRELLAHDGVCVVNEFGTLSFLALAFYGLLLRRPTLLLIENHDKYLRRYGVRRRGLLLLYRRLLVRMADAVLTNGADGVSYATTILRTRPEKLRVGPYLTSVFADAPARPAAPQSPSIEHPLRLAAIGQLIERKGFDVLIREFASLPSSLSSRISLSIFGEGVEHERLQARIVALGLADRIRLEGHVEHSELGRRMRSFDAFVAPTLADYRSLSSFEALALGMPMLVSIHDGACPEVLEEGVNGYSFDPDQRGALASALTRLVAALDRGEPFGDQSRRIAERYSVDSAARALASVITTLAKGESC
jgi:glycosyltransferase involved in cell wall biosynthesis